MSGSELVRRETAKGSSIDFIGYRMPHHKQTDWTMLFTRHKSTNMCQEILIFKVFSHGVHLHNTFHILVHGEQGWCSGESTRLPPMWPGFNSQTRRHMWVEFVGSLLCTERFSPGTPVSPLLKNQNLT